MYISTLKESLKTLFTNRYLTVLSIVLLVLALLNVVYIAIAVRPTELQVVTHYTAFGVTQLYRDQWWYLLSFAVFGVVTALMHIALAIKVYIAKGHPLAISVAWLGVGIIVFAWSMSFFLINIRNML
jgi:hypothetical protein